MLLPNIDLAAQRVIATISDGGAAADRLMLSVETDDYCDFITRATAGDNGDVSSTSTDIANGVIHEVTGIWKTRHVRGKVDSDAIVQDLVATIPDDLDRIEPGQDHAAANQTCGVISNLKLWDHDSE